MPFGVAGEVNMQIAGLPPAMLQALLTAASPKVERAPAVMTGVPEAQAAPAVLPPASQPATSVQMLVAMAAMEPPSERRRRIAEETDRGLSLLERLHAELAANVAAPERLRELAEWAQSFEVPDEPQLAGLAREVELRVRVELAKHERRI